ncbi:MAG: sulfatase-like hydrolase/transferase [Acidobacteria bacterium]|nr:sulfatase-like hydrolase/transferase [Acidobacteriota bacterium]
MKRKGARLSRVCAVIALLLIVLGGCRDETEGVVEAAPPSILLVTLDTTRYDSIGPAAAVETPAFNALVERGVVFNSAWATAPQTLPSHASMLSGLHPAGHGVHQNARRLGDDIELVQEQLRSKGYRTGAFVSALPLARKFGLERGFEVYGDEMDGEERSAIETASEAMAWLKTTGSGPVFLWVHFFEPHYPYAPPEGIAAPTPYLGEIVAVDNALGDLVREFEARRPAGAIIVAGDHGEGLGEHGEAQHGMLAYRSTMQVPLVIRVEGESPRAVETPVSIRRIFHTVRAIAGEEDELSLLGNAGEIVVGEAMQPYLAYGWQPQVMATWDDHQAIFAGVLEAYDLQADPAQSNDLGSQAEIPRPVRAALTSYPIPSISGGRDNVELSDEERRQLASLGYVTGGPAPAIREDAPRPVEMADLFDELDRASGAFAAQRWEEAIPILREILALDESNLMAALRLAAAYSATGDDEKAMEAFRRAREIAPDSPDVDHYEGLHHARQRDWERAVPLLEESLRNEPGRLAAIEALARQRASEGRFREALDLWERADAIEPLSADQSRMAGAAAMRLGDTPLALKYLERARSILGARFENDLELGVLYLETRRFREARAALDRAVQRDPENPMALFKRAQLSVLLGEPEASQWIAKARRAADAVTAPLIDKERLFEGY